nr:CIA30 family protein [Roseospira goensis]
MCPPPRWRLVTDGVMGGLSQGQVVAEPVRGRSALVLTGTVSLENNGGFIQMACDLRPDGAVVDARGFAAVELDVCGDGETYGLHLRTTDITRPWQSYRLAFVAPPAWTTVTLPLAEAVAHRTDAPFRPERLRRLGLVAIGRAFQPWLAVARIALRGP